MNKSTVIFTLVGLFAGGSYLLWSQNQTDNDHEALMPLSSAEVTRNNMESSTLFSKTTGSAVEKHGPTTVVAKAADRTEETQRQTVDTELDAKLGEALAIFNAKMAEVSAEDVREQRAEIAKIKKEALEAPIVEPTIEVVEDKFGNKMRKLTYDNGVVRYSFL